MNVQCKASLLLFVDTNKPKNGLRKAVSPPTKKESKKKAAVKDLMQAETKDFDLKSESPIRQRRMDHDVPRIKLGKFTDIDSQSTHKENSQETQIMKLGVSEDYKEKQIPALLDVEEEQNLESSRSDRPTSAKVREHRKNLEKGLFGLRVDLRKAEDDLGATIRANYRDFEEIRDEFLQFQQEVKDQFLVIREEMHSRYTEFKAHINDVLLEFKESILIIQSYVDNQLVINRR